MEALIGFILVVMILTSFVVISQKFTHHLNENIDCNRLFKETAPYEDYLEGNELLKGSHVIVQGPLRVYQQVHGVNNFYEFYIGIKETKKITIEGENNQASMYIGPYKFMGELHLGLTGFQLNDFEIKKNKGCITTSREYNEIFNLLNRLNEPNFVYTLRQLLLHWAIFERIKIERLEFSNKQNSYFIAANNKKSSIEKNRIKFLQQYTEYYFKEEKTIEEYTTQSTTKKYKYNLRFDYEKILPELEISIKGPIYLHTKKFTMMGFGAGTIVFKDAIDVRIILEKSHRGTVLLKSIIAQNRIIPIHTSKNADKPNIFHTIYYLLKELDGCPIKLHNLQDTMLETLFNLELFNNLIEKGLILDVDEYSFVVPDDYLFEHQMAQLSEKLFQEMQQLFIELDQFNSHSYNAGGSSTESQIEHYLSILELDSSIRNFTVIKQQYKKLVKKYHPDLANGDSQKMTEINVAYEALESHFNEKSYS